MNPEDFITELSHLKAILILDKKVDMNRFNVLYQAAQNAMFKGERINKELMEEFLYFRNLIGHQ